MQKGSFNKVSVLFFGLSLIGMVPNFAHAAKFANQFTEFELETSKYKKAMNALDFLSGMTDEYATEMYRKLKGIAIPRHD